MSAGRARRRDLPPALRYRKAGGWSQIQVATAAGVAVNVVRKLEQADPAELRRLELGSLLRVAHALGVTSADLIPALVYKPKTPGLIEHGWAPRPPKPAPREGIEDPP